MGIYCYQRRIYFADTDSAGVVYFANLLSICHEAYEFYLTDILKLNLANFFRDQLMAIPIIHADIDFFQPLFCGDRITIELSLKLVNYKVFETNYVITKQQEKVATALTRHICINPQTRKTQTLPEVFLKNLTV